MQSKTFQILSDYKNVSSACFIIKTFCEDLHMAENQIKEIELSLAEALNNIIKHAYQGVQNKIINIEIEYSNNNITINLIDNGIARKNLNKPKLEFDPENIDSLPEGGMGLFIIEQLMDENIYKRENDKNIFTLIKKVD